MKHIALIFLVIAFSGSLPLLAQNDSIVRNDSIAKAEKIKKQIYSGPRKASIMSAVLPGLGQAYNRKYWKIPLIYAGLGGFGYMLVTNHNQYKTYRGYLRAEYDDDPLTKNTTGISGENLAIIKNGYRKSRDLAGIAVVLIYLLNIIDANVDAHLKTFDVSDDLSFRAFPSHEFVPVQMGMRQYTGFTLQLNFK